MNERGHLSAETLDLLALAALPEAESSSARAHLSECGRCKGRWAELEEDKQKFEQFVFPRTLPKIQERAQRRSFFQALAERWQLAVPALGLVAAGVIAVVVVPKLGSEPYRGLKGGPSVEVVAQRGTAQFEVKPEAHLKPGDQIRFVVEPAGARYLIIASRDGRGAITVYFPYGGAESAALAPSKQDLPGSIELDDALGAERLFALFSEAPLQTESVKAAIASGENVDKIPGVKAAVVKEFVKEAP